MKKQIFIIFTLLMSICVGCKSVPSDAKVYTVSYAVGAASAKVVDKTNVNEKTTKAIIKTLNTVQICVPATNETFTAKWMPIVSTNSKNMVISGELTQLEAVIIEKTFVVICNGLDYIIEKRYPDINVYENLMSSAIYGFNAGFLTYFNTANTFASRSILDNIDEEEYLKALEYLKTCNK